MNRNALMLSSLVAGAVFLAALMAGVGGAVAETTATEGAPQVMSYQGFLTSSSGQPVSGTVTLALALYDASSGGNLVWQEEHTGVPVQEGYFTVLLGSNGTPLTASVFSSETRYLQVTVDGGVPLPRQRIGAVPYALRATAADTATNALTVPWTGITDRPFGLDDGDNDTLASLTCSSGEIAKYNGSSWACATDGGGGQYEHVIVVAKSGGDYTSVAAALASIGDASASNRYLVWVAPGVYTESDLSKVQPYVHLQGAGANVTVIRSTRTSTVVGPDAATLEVADSARLSKLTVLNEGVASTFAIAVYSSAPTSRSAVIEQIVAEANGAGGTAHFAIYLNDAEPTIRNSSFKASGAVGGAPVNTALGSVNIDGGFPQPLIENAHFEGKGGNSGFGFQMTNSAPDVRHSYIFGDFRGIFAGVNGITEVQNSHLQEGGFNDAFLFETTGSATVLVANSGVFYLAGPPSHKHTGTGGLVCVHAYKANYTAATDGNTPATACN